MNEHFAEQILKEARLSMKPTDADSDRVMKKVLASVVAASAVAGTSAVAAKASGATGLFSSLVGGSAIAKLVVGIASICGALVLSVWLIQRPKLPAAASGNEGISHPVLSHQGSAVWAGAESTCAIAAGKIDLENVAKKFLETESSSSVPMKTAKVIKASAALPDAEKQSVITSNDDLVLREISIVKSASSALKNGRPADALSILNEYEKTSGKGVMTEERDGLRITALCVLGQTQQARTAVRRFQQKFKGSVMALHISDSCRELDLKPSER
jgi:hypothetical protein